MSDSPTELADSFEQILRERETEILRTAFRILGNWADAEDVAQESFLRLHRHGIDFVNDAALRSWLYRVAVNLCLDRVRMSKPFEELPELESASASVEAVIVLDERKRAMMTALGKLALRERAAIVLREIEGLSTAEVAAVLGSSEVTVRSQVAKAIRKLRGLLSGERL